MPGKIKTTTWLLYPLLWMLICTLPLCKKEYSCEQCNGTAQTQTAPVSTGHPPIARAGNDTSIMLPAKNAILDGSASTDPDNNISQYQWTNISGGSASINDPQGKQTIITAGAAGVYKVVLVVTDKTGLSASDTIQVTVLEHSDIPIGFADAGADQVLTLPLDSAYLDASRSVPNGFSSIPAVYTWTQVSGPGSMLLHPFITRTGYQTTTMIATKMQPGNYVFKVEVRTASGASSDEVSIQVLDNPQDPNTVTFKGLVWETGDIYGIALKDVYLNSTVRHDIFTPTYDYKPVKVYLDLKSNGNWQLLQDRTSAHYSYDAAPELLWIYSLPADFSLVGTRSAMKIKLP